MNDRIDPEPLGTPHDRGEGEQDGPQETDQADEGRARFRNPFAEFVQDTKRSRPLVGPNSCRAVGFGDLVEKRRHGLVGANHLGPPVAYRAVNDPGSDGVHSFDLAQVDRQRIGRGGQFTLGRRGAGNGQRTDAAVRITSLGRIGGGRLVPHRPRPCSKSDSAASPQQFASLLGPIMPYSARWDDG